MRALLDSNTWIDLRVGNLLGPATACHPATAVLALEPLTADLRDPGLVEQIRGLGVGLITADPSTVAQVANWRQTIRSTVRVSHYDLLALGCATACGAVLVSGDRALREVAEKLGVRVHGTLWLLDRWVATGALRPPEAAAGLARMLAAGRRLPGPESQAHLDRWRTG